MLFKVQNFKRQDKPKVKTALVEAVAEKGIPSLSENEHAVIPKVYLINEGVVNQEMLIE